MKRELSLIISSVVFCQDAVGFLLRRILGRNSKIRVVVLCYHRVFESNTADFDRQMYLLKKWTSPLRADSLLLDRPTSRHSAVTFDDAFSDTLRRILPIMKDRKIPFTVFVPTGFVGNAPGWIDETSRDGEEVASSEELLEISKEPLVKIGSHCVTHRRLSELNDRSAGEEISHSKKEIEAIISETSDLIAFPHGDFSPRHLEMARRCGYSQAFSIQPDVLDPTNWQFLIGRINVEPSDSDLEFILKITGSYRWKSAASRLKKSIRTFFMSGESKS